MLNENIKTIRKAKGLSQEELAIKLNVVRQTVSKWEHGLSVPDSEMLVSLSEVLETPVSILLGEPVIEPQADDLKAISEKLEIINLQLARSKAARRKALHWLLIALVRRHSSHVCSPRRMEQLLSWMGFQRPGNRRCRRPPFTLLSGCSSASLRLF